MQQLTSSPLLMRRTRRFLLIVLLVAVLGAGWGIFTRIQAQAALKADTHAESVVHVDVVLPQRELHNPDLVLPGTLQAWTETPIYAHTSGYLKRWLVDIGQPVKAGQLIAEIDTPEVDQQLAQAEADLHTAQANAQLAQLTADRYRALLPTHTVSQQDLDNKLYDAAAKQAAEVSAQDNLARLRQLDVYKRIVAPVNGILTARNADIGTMIDSGSANGNAHELFHMADIHRLRVYVPVPESEANLIHPGATVMLDVRERPGKSWPAQLVHSASAIDPVSHTLLAELQLDNPDNALFPGGYVEAHFKRKNQENTFTVPSNALIFRSTGTLLAIVNPDHTVHLQAVSVGKDLGNTLEISTGLKADQAVVISPPDSIAEGQIVMPNRIATAGSKS